MPKSSLLRSNAVVPAPEVGSHGARTVQSADTSGGIGSSQSSASPGIAPEHANRVSIVELPSAPPPLITLDSTSSVAPEPSQPSPPPTKAAWGQAIAHPPSQEELLDVPTSPQQEKVSKKRRGTALERNVSLNTRVKNVLEPIEGDPAKADVPIVAPDNLMHTQHASQRVALALCFIDDALHGRLANGRAKLYFKPTSVQRAFLLHTGWLWKAIVYTVPVVFSALFLWEPLRGGPTSYTTLPAELTCILLYLVDIALKMSYMGSKNFLKKKWHKQQVALVVLYFLDFILFWTSACPVRFARPLRPAILLVRHRDLRRVFFVALDMAPNIAKLLLMLFGFIMLFAVVGVNLFADTYSAIDAPVSTAAESVYAAQGAFDNVLIGSLRMLVLFSTENYPFVALPAYKTHQASFIFFFIFLYLGVFFLTSMLLGLIVSLYFEYAQKRVNEERKKEWKGLLRAFTLLDPEHKGHIDLKQWRELMRFLRPNATPSEASFFFELLDRDEEGQIDCFDFLDLREVLLLQIQEIPSTPKAISMFHFKCNLLATSIRFHYTGLILLALNSIVACIYYKDMSNDARFALLVSNCVLTFCNLSWSSLRLVGIWHTSVFTDKLDVLTCFTALVLVVTGTALQSSSSQMPLALVANMLVFLRVVWISKDMQFGVLIVWHITEMVLHLSAFMMIVMYLYGAVGMELFSTTKAEDAQDEYYADFDCGLGFETVGCTAFTLFQIMVGSNWNEAMNSLINASNYGAAVFFVSFFVVINLALMDILVAVTIEAFLLTKRHFEGVAVDDIRTAFVEIPQDDFSDVDKADLVSHELGEDGLHLRRETDHMLQQGDSVSRHTSGTSLGGRSRAPGQGRRSRLRSAASQTSLASGLLRSAPPPLIASTTSFHKAATGGHRPARHSAPTMSEQKRTKPSAFLPVEPSTHTTSTPAPVANVQQPTAPTLKRIQEDAEMTSGEGTPAPSSPATSTQHTPAPTSPAATSPTMTSRFVAARADSTSSLTEVTSPVTAKPLSSLPATSRGAASSPDPTSTPSLPPMTHAQNLWALARARLLTAGHHFVLEGEELGTSTDDALGTDDTEGADGAYKLFKIKRNRQSWRRELAQTSDALTTVDQADLDKLAKHTKLPIKELHSRKFSRRRRKLLRAQLRSTTTQEQNTSVEVLNKISPILQWWVQCRQADGEGSGSDPLDATDEDDEEDVYQRYPSRMPAAAASEQDIVVEPVQDVDDYANGVDRAYGDDEDDANSVFSDYNHSRGPSPRGPSLRSRKSERGHQSAADPPKRSPRRSSLVLAQQSAASLSGPTVGVQTLLARSKSKSQPRRKRGQNSAGAADVSPVHGASSARNNPQESPVHPFSVAALRGSPSQSSTHGSSMAASPHTLTPSVISPIASREHVTKPISPLFQTTTIKRSRSMPSLLDTDHLPISMSMPADITRSMRDVSAIVKPVRAAANALGRHKTMATSPRRLRLHVLQESSRRFQRLGPVQLRSVSPRAPTSSCETSPVLHRKAKTLHHQPQTDSRDASPILPRKAKTLHNRPPDLTKKIDHEPRCSST
eukprot:m.29025 g.29025  ORF g.29025 m.29025 type:complete len:1552 (-) comp9106_c0_seq1:407-5062(-)